MIFPPPVVERHGAILVVRDDLLPGGTKRRVIDRLLVGADEFVYASPAYGYAQVALAYACRDLGLRATIVTAARRVPHPRTVEAAAAGARIIPVPCGYLTVVRAAARRYADESGARLLPFGFDDPAFVAALADIARSLPVTPSELWSVAGSGTLNRALQLAWPNARAYAVRVGQPPHVGAATLLTAPEPFERDAKEPPPFPSTANFDAKAWRFICRQACQDAVFWNVAA